MVHGVNGPNGINGDIKIKLNNVDTSTGAINSTFGDGFGSASGVSVERYIPGLEDLMAKFDFEPPKYTKNIPQLVIKDNDYIPDRPFVWGAFCEV